MSQIKIKCPHCQSEMEGEEEWIGQEAACPFCQKNFVISRDPVRPTLVRPAVPPKSGKKIVFLIAGGAVVLLLAIGGVWFAFSGSSPGAEQPKTAMKKPVEILASKPAVKTESEFDISHLVSGLPRAKKPDKPFRIEEYIDRLTPPPDTQYTVRNRPEEWKEAADRMMIDAVRNGRVWDIFALLELGYEINGLYQDNRGDSSQYIQNQPLSAYLMTGSGGTEGFLRAFLFLAENGLDLNQCRADGKRFTAFLLNFCDGSKDRNLWRLIPYAVAHGAKFDQMDMLGIRDSRFRDYVSRAKELNIKPPAPVEDVRLSFFADFDKEVKEADSPLKNPIRAMNPGFRNPLFCCDYQVPKLTTERLRNIFRKGFHPNALLLCTWGGHGGGGSFADRVLNESPLGFRIAETRDLAYLLSNGWRLGMEKTARKGRISREQRLLLWEYGASVTAGELNSVRDKEKYNFLLSLYRKQYFNPVPVTLRNETFWNYMAAEQAVDKNDLPALRKLVENGVDVNYSDESTKPLLWHACRSSQTKGEIVRFLLDRGADPNKPWKNCYNQPFDCAISCGNIEVAEILLKTGKIPKPQLSPDKCTKLCSVLYDMIAVHSYRTSYEKRLQVLNFLIDKAGYQLHASCPQCQPTVFDALVKRTGNQDFVEYRHLFFEWLLARGFKPSAKAVDEAIAKQKDLEKRSRRRSGKPNEYLAYLEQLKQSGKTAP